MGEWSATGGGPRRRERATHGTRAKRIKVSYSDDELGVVQEAASWDGVAVASWIADAALSVAKMRLVPVSADLKDVLQELIESRRQLRRVGIDLNQLTHVRNAGATVTEQQLAAMVQRVDAAVKRVDEATLQVMRERKPRS